MIPSLTIDLSLKAASWAAGCSQVVDIKIEAGTHFGVIGANGAGKTTFLRALAGLGTMSGMSVMMEGVPVEKWRRSDIARHVAYLSQSDGADGDMKVKDYIALSRLATSDWSDHHLTSIASQCDVTAFLDRSLGQLSGGERQKVSLARCLAQKPDVLLLDEPTNHLDIASRIRILHLIRDLPITVISVLHDLHLVTEFTSRVLLLDHGLMRAFDTVEAVFDSPAFRDAFGVRAVALTPPYFPPGYTFVTS